MRLPTHEFFTEGLSKIDCGFLLHNWNSYGQPQGVPRFHYRRSFFNSNFIPVIFGIKLFLHTVHALAVQGGHHTQTLLPKFFAPCTLYNVHHDTHHTDSCLIMPSNLSRMDITFSATLHSITLYYHLFHVGHLGQLLHTHSHSMSNIFYNISGRMLHDKPS